MNNTDKDEQNSQSADESNCNAKKKKCRKKISSESEQDLEINFDYNLKFDSELEDKPEILSFISSLQELIKKQARKIKKLKSNLKNIKKKPKHKNASTQVEFKDIKCHEVKSLTEEITEAAENAMQQTGFVYEATSGMYYDFNSGYYYNAELGLYYDGNSGTYLVYNNDTQKYEFHSQVDVVSTKPLVNDSKVKRKKHQKEQVKNSIDGLLQNFSQLSIDHLPTQALEISKSWPPCMRIILKETTIEKLKIGSLHIITCDGGKIGREGNVAIIIPDINVSKSHAEILFDKNLNSYIITDLGSQNGTILNGKRISGPKQKSDPQIIMHGSILQIGTTKLLCHIHDGQKTCGHCEPGLIQVDSANKSEDKPPSKNSQYKKELKRLKKKFGLESQDSVSDLGPGYSDRAEERRKKVGSHNEKEKTQSSSLDQSIAKENKGFKMLAKMGWSEGQSLGKDGSGLKEPVPLVCNQGKAGLGSSASINQINHPINVSMERKNTVWKKTQQRYNLVQDVNLNAFKNFSSDEEEKT